ncbi:two-component system regulatory protein YycI [Limosilactobacillus caecicola]|uniref:two-component system regulatory protein YycI n=1 Tax=Limosilactobacillus caecicola TaxID=2941332 RepID=UPI00203F354D|nr:two-component system regulatory protein YycI [Limosilactobacillus caecicola]
MNFKRIQWIFILAFVLLDLGLCLSLFMGTQFHNSTQQQSQTQITLKEMKNDMISFNQLSNKRRDGYYVSAADNQQWTNNNHLNTLKGQSARISNGIVTSTFDKTIKVKPGIQIQAQLDKLVHSKRILHGQQYTYSAALSSTHQVVYTQTVHGQPVLERDGQIRIRINDNNEVTGYTQGYVGQFKNLRPRAMTVSQQQAVTWLYRHNQIANNSRIRYVLLGYAKSETVNNRTVYLPVWNVNVKSKADDNSQNLRVNAFSNTIFTTKQSN